MLRSDRELTLSESYLRGDFDVTGDLLAVFPVAEYLPEKQLTAAQKLRLGALLLGMPPTNGAENSTPEIRDRLHSKSRDRQAVGFHYDVSNEFSTLARFEDGLFLCLL